MNKREKSSHLEQRVVASLSSYLGDAVEAAHQRVERVEEAQDVVQVSAQSWVVGHKQLNQRGRHHTHLKGRKHP